MEKITTLLVDDHKLVREAYSFMLSSDTRFEVVAMASSGEEAYEMAMATRPQVILMDINMNGMSGFDATEKIIADLPEVRIIGVSMHAVPAYAKRMFGMGARGYVTKNSPREEFIKAILEVSEGKLYICQEIKEVFSKQEFNDTKMADISVLSKREVEIVKHVKSGMSSKEISSMLGLSLKTIEVHRYNILRKLNVKNLAGLLQVVHDNGL